MRSTSKEEMVLGDVALQSRSNVTGTPKDHWGVPTSRQGAQWKSKQIQQVCLETDLQMALSRRELDGDSSKICLEPVR